MHHRGGGGWNVCASADGAGQTEPSPLGLQAASVPANRIKKTGSVVTGTNPTDWSRDVTPRRRLIDLWRILPV